MNRLEGKCLAVYNVRMSEEENQETGDIRLSTGLCEVCGKPTSSPLMALDTTDEAPTHDEPYICNRCLVDIKTQVYTELEVRNRVTHLESEVKVLGTKVWVLSTLFALCGIVIGFVLGVAFGC